MALNHFECIQCIQCIDCHSMPAIAFSRRSSRIEEIIICSIVCHILAQTESNAFEARLLSNYFYWLIIYWFLMISIFVICRTGISLSRQLGRGRSALYLHTETGYARTPVLRKHPCLHYPIYFTYQSFLSRKGWKNL